MAVSTNWVGTFVGVLTIRALLLGVYIKAPDFWKLPSVCLGAVALGDPERAQGMLLDKTRLQRAVGDPQELLLLPCVALQCLALFFFGV